MGSDTRKLHQQDFLPNLQEDPQSFFLFQTVFPGYVTTGRGYANPVASEACMSHLLPESYAPPSSLQEGVCQFGGNSYTTMVTLLEGISSLLPFNGQNNAL